MRAQVAIAGQVTVSAPPQSDKTLGLIFPVFGPFPDWTIKVGELEADQCSETFDLGGRSSLLFLVLDGNATLEWDFNAGTATLDNEDRYCGLPKCSDGPQYLIVKPVCDIEHIRVCAGEGCGVQFELSWFGVPAPVQA